MIVSRLEVSNSAGGGGTVIDGSLRVCPGTTVSLNCSHDSVEATLWEIGAPIGCSGTASHTATPSDALCGTFTINMVSAEDQPTRTSILLLPVDQSLNGAVVTCYAGGLRSNPQAGNLTIQVVGETNINLFAPWADIYNPFISLQVLLPLQLLIVWNIQWVTQLLDGSDSWLAVAGHSRQRSLFLPVWLEAMAQWLSLTIVSI